MAATIVRHDFDRLLGPDVLVSRDAVGHFLLRQAALAVHRLVERKMGCVGGNTDLDHDCFAQGRTDGGGIGQFRKCVGIAVREFHPQPKIVGRCAVDLVGVDNAERQLDRVNTRVAGLARADMFDLFGLDQETPRPPVSLPVPAGTARE